MSYVIRHKDFGYFNEMPTGGSFFINTNLGNSTAVLKVDGVEYSCDDNFVETGKVHKAATRYETRRDAELALNKAWCGPHDPKVKIIKLKAKAPKKLPKSRN